MSWRTERLAALMPAVYAAEQDDALLRRLLDALGAELTRADSAVTTVLRSHWVDWAAGDALDGLGATFGVRRRVLAGGGEESDDAFRQRLRSLVSLYTGGGTVRSVLGAVRSALGLPFDLADLPLPPGAQALRADLERLITLSEFSPEVTEVRAASSGAVTEDEHTRLDLEVDLGTARPESPRIEVLNQVGVARNLSVELLETGEGVRAGPALGLRAQETLRLESDPRRGFSAVVEGPDGLRSVTRFFTGLGGGPPGLPPVPGGRSTWVVRAGSGFADGRLGSAFDEDAFDLPLYDLAIQWVRYQLLTFEVQVPYRLREDVAALAERYGHHGLVFLYEGLPRERLQEVVDQTRAAGVRGRVSFGLTFLEDHRARERFLRSGTRRVPEDAGMRESLTTGSLSTLVAEHDQLEQLHIGAVLDFSTFDDPHQGFQG